ncbi:MAG: hypothetical protein ABW049_09840 [Spongiibacteraceae bacterium]
MQERVAALDLGSNSFHVLVAEPTMAGWQALLRQGEKVQLAAGLQDGKLSEAAITRGLECLARFAPHLRNLPGSAVRAVGTHALRVAANRDEFLRPAEQLIGHPIRVIDGLDEARLIYRGAAVASGRQLVIDIGGGSTEIVLGAGARIEQLASVPIGCITLLQFFPDGRIDDTLLTKAVAAAAQHIRVAWPGSDRSAVALGADVIGCSGTLLAVEQILLRAGWSAGGITRAGLQHLRAAVLNYPLIDAVQFEGLSESRRGVFATGLAIVLALFEALGIDHMQLSKGALREGLIAELMAESQPQTAALTHPRSA